MECKQTTLEVGQKYLSISRQSAFAILQNNEAGQVKFNYKDYQDNSRKKQMELTSDEFIRRFLLHVLPDGFMRIRHYGFMANACRHKKHVLIMEAIAGQTKNDDRDNPIDRKRHETWSAEKQTQSDDNTACTCPQCKSGTLYVIKTIPPKIKQKG